MTGRIFQRVIWVGAVAIVGIVLAGATLYLRLQSLSDASSARHIALASMLSLSAVATALMVVLLFVSRRAAQEVRRREERLLTTLSSIGDGVIATDANCAIRFVNRVASELTGWSQAEAEGRPLAEVFKVVGAEDRLPAVSPAARILRERVQSVLSKDTLLIRRDGAQFLIECSGAPIRGGDGEISGAVMVFKDVTAASGAQLALQASEERLRRSQKLDALGTLAGGIAHDFNNILAVLRGNLALIEGEVGVEHRIMPAVLDMENACNRAAALVRQILTFGRRRVEDQDRAIVRLEEVVAEGVQLLRATLPAEIEIRFSYAPGLSAVFADPNQIYQVITNLGINASHAIGRRPGLIEIQLESVQVDAEMASAPDLHEGRYVRVRFTDDGCGMPQSVLERIFEPFFTTKAPNGGTGLGLSVVRGILKNHDGAISVYSEAGRGTRFHLYFPAADEKAPAVVPKPTEPQRGHGERILYVDDEESLVVLAKRMLERMGYRVTGFNDSSQALAAFEASPDDFDLVLTDLSMPGMSGMEVSRRMLKIRPDLPVLLATGYVRNEDVEQARAIGIREVIWKPQTIAEMGDLLAQQLHKLAPG